MSKSLRDEIRAVLAVSIAAMVLSPVAFAQEQQKPDEEKEEAATEAEFQEVVVTGSRIRRTEFTSASPVQVITSERSQLAGLLSTEEILRNSTVASGQQVNDSFSGFITDGGPGANQISLRGLGAQRTLVLVNGRRWSPSGVQGFTNSVDLTAIPSSIVERYEILKDGASSIYGADAVAGVVNVITKTELEGLQLNAQGAATEHGGGERYAFDASWGTVGDRGSFSISAQYAEQKELVAADREWAACPTSQRWTDQAPPDGNIDNRDPVTGEPLCFGFIYGLASSGRLGFLRYEPSLAIPDPSNPYYDPATADRGLPFYTRVPVNGWSVNGFGDPLFDNEGAYYRDELSPLVSMIQTPSTLISATSFGQLDFDLFSGTSTVYYEAFYNQRETDSSGGYRQFFPTILPVTDEWLSDTTGTVPFALHPFNPFSNLIFERGRLNDGVALPVIPSWNIQDPVSTIDIERYNAFVGVKGDLAGSWDYDIVFGYGRSEGTYERQQWLDDRVYAATNQLTVRPDGSVTCDDTALAAFPDCVPLNLFTEDAMLRGIIPADALAFISKDTKGRTVYDGYQASAYATGDLFSVPAGTVKAVFGGEYRKESIDDVPDPDAQINNFWGFTTAGITKGEDTVQELFTELEVPLLNGKRYAEDMFVSLSARWTDYDSYGDDVTYRGAFSYQVTPQFLVRSTYGTSFRAPDLYEQFLADNVGFSSVFDPCNQYGVPGSGLQPGDAQYDNCAAQGLPPDYSETRSITTFTGGADDLEAETSESLTIGLVFTPQFADISFALDYFDIQIEDTVESPTVGYIFGQCYTSVGLSSQLCNRVGPRDPLDNFRITFVDSSFVNVGKQQSRGYDFNLVYQHQFEVGGLTIDAQATYLDKQNFELFGEFTRLEGRWAFPRLSARSQLRYDWRDWQFGWTMTFIGESEEAPVFDPGTSNQDRQNRTPNYLTHSLSMRYRTANWDAIFTVRNAFDKDPPFVADGQGSDSASRIYNTLPGAGYDLFGRTYALQLSYKL